MIFNGLSGSDLVVYNAVVDMLQGKLKRTISAPQLATKTGYTDRTVRTVMSRLVEAGLVDRDLPGPGKPYEYSLAEDQ